MQKNNKPMMKRSMRPLADREEGSWLEALLCNVGERHFVGF